LPSAATDLSKLNTGFVDEVVRVYVDDLTKPAYEARLADLQAGTDPLFAPPLTSSQSGAVVSYVPIS
jgi:hypothetical protein